MFIYLFTNYFFIQNKTIGNIKSSTTWNKDTEIGIKEDVTRYMMDVEFIDFFDTFKMDCIKQMGNFRSKIQKDYTFTEFTIRMEKIWNYVYYYLRNYKEATDCSLFPLKREGIQERVILVFL